MYRIYQMEQQITGPLSIYTVSNTLLFLSAWAGVRLCRIISFDTLRMAHRIGFEYCFLLYGPAQFILVYVSKQRAISCVRQYLQEHHVKLFSRYVPKVQPDFETDPMTRWAKRIIRKVGQQKPNCWITPLHLGT